MVLSELCDKFIAARNAKPPWSTEEHVRNVHGIEHDDVVSSRIFPDKVCHEDPREGATQASTTLE